MQAFYDDVGWAEERDQFADALLHEDLRPVCRAYVRDCHLRVRRYLPARGRVLLDVASGPLQYEEYLTYSDAFDLRVCVDLSAVALRAARRKLGDRGAYIQADATRLPIRDGVVDAFVSIHTLYHVPSDEQAGVMRELSRVLAPGGCGVLVYSWGSAATLMRLLMPRLGILTRLRAAKHLLLGGSAKQATDALYFHSHGPAWFEGLGLDLQLRVWRSVSVPFLQRYVHGFLGGRRLLEWVYWLEETFPQRTGRWGQYPLFVLRKR